METTTLKRCTAWFGFPMSDDMNSDLIFLPILLIAALSAIMELAAYLDHNATALDEHFLVVHFTLDMHHIPHL